MPKHASDTLVIQTLDNPQHHTLTDLFSAVAGQAWSLLLDTAGSTASNGRYNIMLWSPRYQITARQGVTQVLDSISGDGAESAQPPLEVVKAWFDEHFANVTVVPECQSLAAQLPFLAGAAGMLSYDLGRYYEQLPSHAQADYQCPDMAIGLYQRALIEDTHQGTIHDCRFSSLPAFDPQQWLAAHPQTATPFTLTSRWQSNLSHGDYVQALDTIHHYLTSGDCYQVNMAQRFSATYRGSEWSAYRRLQEANQAPFSAFMRLPESCVMSISPERFLSVKNGRVETKPIKGTRPRYSQPEQDQASAEALLNSEKDRAENLMIVDLLRNDLSKHCQPGTVQVPNLFDLESYAAVHHMVSTVEGQLKDTASPLDLLAGAFPGGSITGAPKVRAMEIIEQLEPHRRSVYCGSMMYLGIQQDMDSSICIRTVLAENGHLHCWAGGGIVLDSNAEEEYQETFDKVSCILPVLERTD